MYLTDFNSGWRYTDSDTVQTRFHGGGSALREVNLPYDAMILKGRTTTGGATNSGGYFPGGTYVYYKDYFASREDAFRNIYLELEGAYANTMVFLNDCFAGKCPHGYSNFYVSLDNFLKYGEKNTIKIVSRSGFDSRWYSGGGIYRDVNLIRGDLLHIPPDGLRISTPDIESDLAVVQADITVENKHEEESLMITSDFNFIDVDFYVEYRYSDPVKALYASKDPLGILKITSQSCIRTVIGSYSVDDVLTTGKNEIQAAIKEMILERLEKQDIGIQLVNITIQDSEPPTTEVMEAFKAVETAKQGKETALNNANKYRNEQLPSAQAQADGIIKEAEARKTERINEATAQVSRFNAMYEEYIKNPVVTRQRMFYEAMEDVLPGLKVIIEGSGSNMQTIYPLDSFTGSPEGSESPDGTGRTSGTGSDRNTAGEDNYDVPPADQD